LEKYFEKVFEPLETMIFPVGLCGSEEREAIGAVDCDVFCAMRHDMKKGKMFWEMACQVLLRLTRMRRCLVVWWSVRTMKGW
jgi:hypothetical protein